MAWTAPATWLAGSTLTAAQLNEQVRDNSLAGGPIYATTAARDAAIPAPFAGQRAFVTATNLNYQYSGTAWVSPGALSGSAINVQSTHKTTSWTAALSLSWQDVTGFSVAITPTAATSKVLVQVVAHVGSTVGGLTQLTMRVQRGGGAVTLPFASSCRISATTAQGLLMLTYLDSPATTAATTYQVQIAGTNGNTNYTYLNLTGDATGVSTSSITVQEVPA